MQKVKHVIGISGGKDSAALAIYLNDQCPGLEVEYYFCDTGKELEDTYKLIENLESYLGKTIRRLHAAENSPEDPFDHFYKIYRGYIPSATARWCTKLLKLQPFEAYVGTSPVISYVGIRGDENREGYISKKSNIQSIFPFRKNIWSEDVWNTLFLGNNPDVFTDLASKYLKGNRLDRFAYQLAKPISAGYLKKDKIEDLLDLGIAEVNHTVFDFLKSTAYPLASEEDFPLLDNEEILVRKDIFRLLEDSGVGVPAYYKKIEFEVDGQKGEYARSRSGCFFCFFQQKIEWVWLYEQHPELFKKAMTYENEEEAFTWNENESLQDLIHPARIREIKLQHLQRNGQEQNGSSPFLIDILEGTEGIGCTACFI